MEMGCNLVFLHKNIQDFLNNGTILSPDGETSLMPMLRTVKCNDVQSALPNAIAML